MRLLAYYSLGAYAVARAEEAASEEAEMDTAIQLSNLFSKRSQDTGLKAGINRGGLSPCPSLPNRALDFIGEGCFWPTMDNSTDFTERTTDCNGKAFPSGVKFYEPVLPFDGKPSSSFHAYESGNGQLDFPDSFAYCRGLGVPGAHVSCPGSSDENAWLWQHHPDQPFGPVASNKGILLGIAREQSSFDDFFCDDGRYSNITYFNWSDGKPSTTKAAKVNIVTFTTSVQWADANPAKAESFGHFFCELNCAALTPCEVADCARNVDPSSTCDDSVSPAVCDCSVISASHVWDASSMSCKTPCEVLDCANTVHASATCVDNGSDPAFCSGAVSEYHLLFREAGIGFVENLFRDDPALFTTVTSHGCWCSKLDQSHAFYEELGGLPLDELDEICRNWFRMRNCNDRLNGGSCKDANILYVNNFYKIYVDQVDDNLTECLATDPNDGSAYSQCELDDCEIDKMFGNVMKDFFENNPSFTAHTATVTECIHHPENDAVRTCEGTVPFLEVVKTHRPATNFFSKTAFSSTIVRVSDFEIAKLNGGADVGYQGIHTVDRPPSDGFEYYECFMTRFGLPSVTILMGWANKNNLFDQPGDSWAGHESNELVVYHGWSGKLVHKKPGQSSGGFDLIDLQGGNNGQTSEVIQRHDTAGVGWNRVTNEIIFTRNGVKVAKFDVGTDIVFSSPHHEMISTVQLWFQNDRTVCTWDSSNWMYTMTDLANIGWN